MWLRLLLRVLLGLGKRLFLLVLLRGLFLQDKDLLLLVLLLGLVLLDQDLLLMVPHLGRARLDRGLLHQPLHLGLLLQMLFQFLEITMLCGALLLQELCRLQVDTQSLQLCLPTNLPRTGSPLWAG